MARQIKSRLKISGTLIAKSPLHVGGNDNDGLVDLALALNGQEEYYIPGTSLAGAFRAWMTRNNSDKFTALVNNLWGIQKENSSDPGHASFVLIEDAPIQDITAEIRDGVGIDRYLGTAAEQVKFDRAILPRGSKIPLVMTIEQGIYKTDYDWETHKAAIAALLRALQEKEIRLGAAKTGGLGCIQLEDHLAILEQDLFSADGILSALRGGGTALSLGALEYGSDFHKQNAKLTVDIDWQPLGPMMVKAEADGMTVNMLPMVSAVNDHFTFVLPGSSIKGALRTQAERIIRTLQLSQLSKEQDFSEQLQTSTLIQKIFGSAARLKRNPDTQKREQQGRLGALAVDDCYANLEIAPDHWQKITAAADENELRQQLNLAKLNHTQQAFHVAVDRWTAGAADGFLYSTLEPMGFEWEPIRLTLDIDWLKQNMSDEIENDNVESDKVGIFLLLILLRDLAAGRIPLGYGSNRGMGAIEVKQIQIKGHGLDDLLQPLVHQELSNGEIAQLPREMLTTLEQQWIRQFSSEATA